MPGTFQANRHNQLFPNLQISIFCSFAKKKKFLLVKKAENSISRFPDRELKFPESGNISSGPDKSGIGKPELAIPKRDHCRCKEQMPSLDHTELEQTFRPRRGDIYLLVSAAVSLFITIFVLALSQKMTLLIYCV